MVLMAQQGLLGLQAPLALRVRQVHRSLEQQVRLAPLARRVQLVQRVRLEQRERPAFEEIRARLVLLVPRAQLVPQGPRVRPERVLRVRLVPMERQAQPELMVWQVSTEPLELMALPVLRDPSGLRGLLDLLATRDSKA